MSMDPSRTNSEKCKLTNRHWIITDGNGKMEHVQGPGVIGKYPDMYPGAHFEYASCCPMTTPNGNMKGSFEMVTPDGEKFEAEVAQYDFIAPAPLML